ncbi:MAG TPA: hypothetical protein VK964_07080 [Nocardioidaceae bacterium]|nr:hypothetical protein [Nocardioidaceae bacterium]
MTDQVSGNHQEWPTHCPACGTELAQATIDLDDAGRDRAELRPGEMVVTDYCPNPECPARKPGDQAL